MRLVFTMAGLIALPAPMPNVPPDALFIRALLIKLGDTFLIITQNNMRNYFKKMILRKVNYFRGAMTHQQAREYFFDRIRLQILTALANRKICEDLHLMRKLALFEKDRSKVVGKEVCTIKS